MKKKEKITYAAVTTVEGSLRSFIIPALEQFDRNKYSIHLMCNMSEEFAKNYSDRYICTNIDFERGLHLRSTISAVFKIYKILKKIDCDIVEYGTENAAMCASIAAFFAGVPVRIYNHWGARYVGFSGTTRLVSKTIEFIAALFSTNVRQVSTLNMEMCIKDGIYSRKKAKVLGKGGTVGVDFAKFDLGSKEDYRTQIRTQYNIPENAFVYGFVGRIQRDKGIHELIDSFKKIYDADNNAVLMLVGNVDTKDPEDLERIKWAEECPNVIFTGRVFDVYRYMSAFDVMVHPTYREGFGMVLQEAAALKTPIITTDIMGPGEFINNGVTGVLVPSKNTEALYTAMCEAKADTDKLKLFADNNYDYTITNFERSVMVNRIVEDRIDLLKKKNLI